MAVNITDFIRAPSKELLDGYGKDQLFKLAEHYEVEIPDKRVKESVIQAILLAGLIEDRVLSVPPAPVLVQALPVSPGLTFEQQRELLLLQLAHQEIIEHARFKEKQLEHQQELDQQSELEMAKIRLQQEQLQFVREGKLSGKSFLAPESASRSSFGRAPVVFDVVRNLWLLPKFNEKEPEMFIV